MKKLLIILCTSMFLCTSCSDFLEIYPETSLSTESLWNDEDDLQMGINYLYTTITYDYTHENRSSDSFGGGANAVSSGTWAASNTDDVWTNCYVNIYNCNDFFENYQKADVSDEIKAMYAGEASFFRAFQYVTLVMRFGDVPLIKTTLDFDSPELWGPRTSKDEVWDFIFEDLDYAVANLPLASEQSVRNDRINKGAAQAFLARAALYAGTHYKYHTGSDSRGYLQKAVDAATGVMQSGEYQLVSDYRTLFLQEGENSLEHILAYNYSQTHGTMHGKPRAVITGCDSEPTKYLADSFLCKDGLPIDKSQYEVVYLPTGTEFENRDPRMKLSLWQPGSDYDGEPFLPIFGTHSWSGYMFKKYGKEEAYSYDSNYVYVDNILIRYAEVLLIYAEANYELNGSITDAQLDASINLLRSRFAGDENELPPLTNAFVTQHGLDMVEMIRTERRSELCSEAFRYYDIVRWKIGTSELRKALIGIVFDEESYPGIVQNLDENGCVIMQTADVRVFDEDKDYLFPIPLREIALNDQLTQNPGW